MNILLGIYAAGYCLSYILACYAGAVDPQVRAGWARVDYLGSAIKCLAWPFILIGAVVESVAGKE